VNINIIITCSFTISCPSRAHYIHCCCFAKHPEIGTASIGYAGGANNLHFAKCISLQCVWLNLITHFPEGIEDGERGR
jgi:hypothetical protein